MTWKTYIFHRVPWCAIAGGCKQPLGKLRTFRADDNVGKLYYIQIRVGLTLCGCVLLCRRLYWSLCSSGESADWRVDVFGTFRQFVTMCDKPWWFDMDLMYCYMLTCHTEALWQCEVLLTVLCLWPCVGLSENVSNNPSPSHVCFTLQTSGNAVRPGWELWGRSVQEAYCSSLQGTLHLDSPREFVPRLWVWR